MSGDRLGPLEREAWIAVRRDAQDRLFAAHTAGLDGADALQLITAADALLAAEGREAPLVSHRLGCPAGHFTGACTCGEINARHCPVHQEPATSAPSRDYLLKQLAMCGIAQPESEGEPWIITRADPGPCSLGDELNDAIRETATILTGAPLLADEAPASPAPPHITTIADSTAYPAPAEPAGGSLIDGALVDVPEELQRLVKRYAELWLGWLPDPDSDAQPWDENDLRAIAVRDIEQYVQRREAAAREAGLREAIKTFSNEYDEALASGCDSNGARDCAMEAVDSLTRSAP